VVAADAGGARETVIDGETGLLVPLGDVDAFADALSSTDFGRFSPERIRMHATGFSTASFKLRLAQQVEALTGVPSPVLQAAQAA
jgi:glycosyltransferase involved in cell wall biosynthesis